MVPFMQVDILPYIGDGRSILDTTPSFPNERWSFRIHQIYIYIYISVLYSSFTSYISQLPQKFNKKDIRQTLQYDKML